LDDQKGFHVLPKRWIVERTLSWLGNYPILSKDYEISASSGEAFIILALIKK
jgi:putative transposase